MYSMKAVTELTGITPDTLRAWERRHCAISPRREANGRRVYNGADIARLRLLKNATELGHSISKIAALSNLELQNLVNEKVDFSEIYQTSALTGKLLDAIETYQISECDRILGLAAIGMTPLALARDLLVPTLVEVGALWHAEKINVAQEHLLSNSIKRTLFSLLQVYQRQAYGPTLVFGALSPERHELGLLMACVIAAGQNCRCYYLGANLPRRDLIHALGHLVPRALVLSIMLKPSESPIIEELTRLREAMPDKTALWLGGPGTASLERDRFSFRCKILSSFEEFAEEISYFGIHPKTAVGNASNPSDR